MSSKPRCPYRFLTITNRLIHNFGTAVKSLILLLCKESMMLSGRGSDANELQKYSLPFKGILQKC